MTRTPRVPTAAIGIALTTLLTLPGTAFAAAAAAQAADETGWRFIDCPASSDYIRVQITSAGNEKFSWRYSSRVHESWLNNGSSPTTTWRNLHVGRASWKVTAYDAGDVEANIFNETGAVCK